VKIVRDFVAGRQGGWIPMWVPPEAGFTESSGRFVFHDLIEHRLCDTGGYHEELMAFGRMLVVRVEHGLIETNNWFQRRGPAAAYDLGIEAANLLRNVEQEGRHWIPLAPAYEPHEDAIDAVHEFLAGLKSGIRSEELETRRGFYGNAKAWVHIGYRDALRRYPDAHRWVHSVHYGCESLGKSDESEALLMRLTVDTETRKLHEQRFASYELRERQFDRICLWRDRNEQHAPY
jgi:hypothetical protein